MVQPERDFVLRKFLDSYYEAIEKYKEVNIESDFKKMQDKPAFWKSVATSILANSIYSIILIIIFWVAKDQIATWLAQLGT